MDLRKKHCKSAKHLFVVRVMFLKCQESDSKVTTLGFAIRKYSLVSSWTSVCTMLGPTCHSLQDCLFSSVQYHEE